MNKADRLKAKAGQDVSLAGYDQGWVAGIIRRCGIGFVNMMRANGHEILEEWKAKQRAFEDPTMLPMLVIRLKKHNYKDSNIPAPHLRDKHTYFLELEGTFEGDKVKQEERNLSPLPIFSPEREAELKREKAVSGQLSAVSLRQGAGSEERFLRQHNIRGQGSEEGFLRQHNVRYRTDVRATCAGEESPRRS